MSKSLIAFAVLAAGLLAIPASAAQGVEESRILEEELRFETPVQRARLERQAQRRVLLVGLLLALLLGLAALLFCNVYLGTLKGP